MGREAVGVSLATLTLTAAVLAGDEAVLAAFFVAVTIFILLGTAAHRLPWLHRLRPPLGATPPPKVNFGLEGHDGMTFQLGPDPMESGVQQVVLRVGFQNDQRHEISPVWLNAYVVGSALVHRCEQTGNWPRPNETGAQLE